MQTKLIFAIVPIVLMLIGVQYQHVQAQVGASPTDMQNMHEVVQYMNIITNMATACTTAAENGDTNTTTSCLAIISQLHNSLRTVIEQNRDAIDKILGMPSLP